MADLKQFFLKPFSFEELPGFLQNIISPTIKGPLLWVKVIFILFSLFFLGGTIYFLLTTTWLKELFLQDFFEVLTYRPYWARQQKGRWKKIIKRLKTDSEAEYKLAVIEAEVMLNQVLERMGYPGSLGEKLDKLTADALPNIIQLREAHQIHNNIVHDPDYKLTLEQAEKVVAVYEQALRDLETI